MKFKVYNINRSKDISFKTPERGGGGSAENVLNLAEICFLLLEKIIIKFACTILSLYGRIRVSKNPYFTLAYFM